MIIYLHGFNTIPSKKDVQYLEENFPNERIYAPYIDYANKEKLGAAIAEIVKVMYEEKEYMFVAKSLGCIIAEYLASDSGKVVFVNPGYGYMEALHKYTKQEKLVNFRDPSVVTDVDPDFLNNIASYHAFSIRGNGTAFVSTDDEILDVPHILDEVACSYQVKMIDGGHSVSFQDIENFKSVVEYWLNYEGYILP